MKSKATHCVSAFRVSLLGGALLVSACLHSNESFAAPGPLQSGVLYWGSCGHRDQGGPFAAISIAQQSNDLKNIFGSTPNTILYRAFGDGQSNAAMASDTAAFQAQGIIPVVVVVAYPPWPSFADESAAYRWAYSTTQAAVLAAPHVGVYEIGNEWTVQSPIFGQWQATGTNGTLPAHWRNLGAYPLHRGAMAGAIAAIRDFSNGAQILAGPTNGWTLLGYVPALADDLVNYNGRNLIWDFTVGHWYNDTPAGPNPFGIPDNFAGGANAYALLRPSSAAAQKPIIWSEFGSSNGNNSAFNNQAAAMAVGLMDNFKAHKNGSATELGVAGGIQFQLYQQPGGFTDLFLYHYSGGSSATIAPQGVAMKDWIAANSGGGSGGGGDWIVVDDPSASIAYTGSWSTHSGGFKESQTVNAEARFAFTGTGIRYFSKVASYLNGSLHIYIDEVLQTTLSNTQPGENNNYLLYENTSLSNAPHTIRVVKASGNWISVNKFEYRTSSGSDTTAPAVSITSPGNGATVSGASINVAANAADNVGVVGVQFKLDGANLGAEDKSSPYAVTWNGTSASIGSHVLTAVAWDAAGNSTTSSPINVTVSSSNGSWTAVNETSASITYPVGSWHNHPAGFRESPTANAEARFTFTGSRIRYYSKTANYLNGTIQIYIDDVLQTTLTNTRPGENNEFLLYQNDSLSSGTHTIRVRKAGGNWISVSKFEYFSP